MEFQLAYVISRLDPENEGVELLSHHLANVREGAWPAVGESSDVPLIAKLYQKGLKSNLPWFLHAAYRAIDHILINIETLGGETELNELDNLFEELKAKEGKNIHPGVYTRMEWTIHRLKERLGQ